MLRHEQAAGGGGGVVEFQVVEEFVGEGKVAVGVGVDGVAHPFVVGVAVLSSVLVMVDEGQVA